ncbi:hypothetical protein AAFC00_003910 [Neodothiora populina]|uniref:Zn(2)-C6 fungal-type domain-containing protein n=1 Tax=Neodothiora populina TaxID=2781224 RepID=A0ABR3PFV6_9PEZI
MSESASTASLARANQACKRCHTRKKRCDRALPQCEACRLSSVQCSFQDQNEESGVFLVAYVRGLEDKVRHLEAQVELSTSASRNSSHGPLSEGGGLDISSSPGQITQRNADGDSLAGELRWLSLEATADRYLGQSSGLSFARLTQAVLKRLKSDQYPFAFESVPSNGRDSISVVEASAPTHAAHTVLYSSATLDIASVISEEQAIYLADCYWSHNHTLYPFLRKVAFTENLLRMYSQPEDLDLKSHTWLYTMWMVLAIGSTARSSVLVDDESESLQYFDRAMEHFEGALSFGATAALSAILLQVSYSFFNKVGPNTWYLVGVGVRIAIGVGLHTAPSPAVQRLPLDVQEYRKRLFLSLYMMDRVVSIALGRPFGIQDHDVEIDNFANVDDENVLPDMILPQSTLRPSAVAVPLHILALRRICGRIFEQVYSNRNRNLTGPERDTIQQNLHQELIQWRRAMPFPLPQSKSLPIPQFSSAWFDLNYYQHVLMLYRPSPLFPVLTLEKVGFIAEASSAFISQVVTMKRQGRYAFNWLNLFSVFTATLTLIYSVTAQPEPLTTYLQRCNALQDLSHVLDLLETFGRKFPSAIKCRDIVQDVMARLESFATSGSPVTPRTQKSHVSGHGSLIDLETSSQIPSRGSELGQEPNDESDLAYPVYSTGNMSYDDLQQRVKGIESPSANRTNIDLNSPGALVEAAMADDFGLSSTPFGTAAAQFMAAGLGTSADMDLDEEMLHFIGSTSDAWGHGGPEL